jgi:hypothetical protein
MTPQLLRSYVAFWIVAAAGTLLGCDARRVTFQGLTTPPTVDAFVTPQLAGSLDADGHFPLPAPDPSWGPQISPARASELAVAYVRTFGPYLRSFLERGHGAVLNFDSLQPARLYYAVSPYAPPTTAIHPGSRKGLGPYYLVHLISGGQYAVTVAVSSLSTDITIAGGRLRYPLKTGNDFLAVGTAVGGGEQRPMSPEQAVQLVSRITGLPAAAAPVLILRGRPFEPQSARWEVSLERPAVFRGAESGRQVNTSTIYVDDQGNLNLPSLAQPSGLSAVLATSDTGHVTTIVSLTGQIPVGFERAQFVGR